MKYNSINGANTELKYCYVGPCWLKTVISVQHSSQMIAKQGLPNNIYE